MLCNFDVYYPINLIFWAKYDLGITSNQAKFEQNWWKNKWDKYILVKPTRHGS